MQQKLELNPFDLPKKIVQDIIMMGKTLFQLVINLIIRKLLALTSIEAKETKKVINNNQLENIIVNQDDEFIKIEQQLESIELLMKILSNEVKQTGIDYNATNVKWNIDVITGEKLTLEEVKEQQKGVEEFIVEDINKTNNYWCKYINTLKENSTDEKSFIQKFYEENILKQIQGDFYGDIYSKCCNMYWNITLSEYLRSKGDEK